MKKILLLLSFTFSLFLVSCNGTNNEDGLIEVKENAIEEISTYVVESDFSVENYGLIVTIISEATTEINNAVTADEITVIVTNTKGQIDLIQTLADEEFEAEKLELIAEIEDFGNQDDYSEANWAAIQKLIEDKSKDILNAQTKNEANQIYMQVLVELHGFDNIDAEYAKGRLSLINIPAVTEEDFALLEAEVDQPYDVKWSIVQGTGILVENNTAYVLRAFENVDVVIKVAFIKDEKTVYEQDFVVTVLAKKMETINVSNVKDYKIGETVILKGLVVGVGANGNAGGQEVIIKDTETFEYIGVRQIPGTYPNFDVVKGEIIEFIGVINEGTLVGDNEKTYISYSEGLKVISEDNEVVWDLDGAHVVANQDDLIGVIENKRTYQLLKITADIYSNKYGSAYDSYYNRFTLDPNNTTFNAIRINGVSPALKNDYSSNNIGPNWTDEMFGVNSSNFADVTGSYPGIKAEGEFYVMLVGGNAYYYQFVFLERSHMQLKVVTEAKETAVVDLNEYLIALDETNYTQENWELLSGVLLDDGIKAINNALTVTEVNNALQNAKDTMNNVEKIVEIEYDVTIVLPNKLDYFVGEEIDLTGGNITVKLDDEVVHEANLLVEMISGFDTTIPQEDLAITITFIYGGSTYIETFEIQVTVRPTVHVGEVKDLDVGLLANFTGLVVGTAANGNAAGLELIIKDLTTFEYIGVRGMPGTYPNFEATKGDIIEFAAYIRESGTKGDNGKKFLSYEENLEVITSNNDVLWDLEDAQNINNQQDLIDLLNSGEMYQFVRITTNIYSNRYGTTYASYYNRITLDPNNTSFSDITVNGISPALRNSITTNNIGDGWTDLMFGINEENIEEVPSTYPGIEFEGEVYVMLIGGNDYYYQFVIFEQDHIMPMPGKNLNLAKEGAIEELNDYVLTFDEADYTAENWLLLSETILNDGITAINAAETVEDVALALDNAKTQMDQVLLDLPDEYEFEFTAPTKLTYRLHQEFDLTGGLVAYRYSISDDVEIVLTLDMLNVETLPNMNIAGDYTVLGEHNIHEFSFIVTVVDTKLSSIEFETLPTELIYNHRDGVNEIDLAGAVLKLIFEDDSVEFIDLTRDMLPELEITEWKLGEVTYPITYLEKTTSLTVTYENQALSISEFLIKDTGEYFDVTGIVVGPNSVFGTSELLIKDKENNDVIGIWNSGITGSYNNISLNEEVLKVGDEIIIRLRVANGTNVNLGKVYGNAVNSTTFLETLMVLSHDNELEYDFIEEDVVEISTQEELINFLNSGSDSFYRYVLLKGVRAVVASGSYRIFFEGVTDLASQTVLIEEANISSRPFIYFQNSNWHLENSHGPYFDNVDSVSYSDPATAKTDFYALYVGGNNFQLVFTILDDAWFLPAEV